MTFKMTLQLFKHLTNSSDGVYWLLQPCLLDGVPRCVVQTFIVPRGLNLIAFVEGFEGTVFTKFGWIAIEFGTLIHGPLQDELQQFW